LTEEFIPCFPGFYISQVVQDFFHRQYVKDVDLISIPNLLKLDGDMRQQDAAGFGNEA